MVTMQTNEKQIIQIKALIIVLNQMRDAVRQVSPKLFQRTENEDTKVTFGRRDMIYETILEALEELEDQLEDLIEEYEEDED